MSRGSRGRANAMKEINDILCQFGLAINERISTQAFVDACFFFA